MNDNHVSKTIRAGLLGGTFDPIHMGHLAIAEDALNELGLDKVFLMPAWGSPFKQEKDRASERDRLEMTRLAAESVEGLEASSFEIEKGDVSYTYDTLTMLSRKYPDHEIWFIIGTDSLMTLDTWHKGPELLRRFHFVHAPRPGFDKESYENRILSYKERFGADIHTLSSRMLPISSTEIRDKVRTGQSISGLVPEAVERYIDEQGLYR